MKPPISTHSRICERSGDSGFSYLRLAGLESSNSKRQSEYNQAAPREANRRHAYRHDVGAENESVVQRLAGTEADHLQGKGKSEQK